MTLAGSSEIQIPRGGIIMSIMRYKTRHRLAIEFYLASEQPPIPDLLLGRTGE
jgi:hypothetical protein